MEQKLYHYTECGLDNVYIGGLDPVRNDAGEMVITIPYINKLLRAIAEGIVSHKKGISGAELRYLRTGMELTQAELAVLVHKDKQTIGRWERCETEMDGATEAFIRSMAIEKLKLNVNLDMEEIARRSVATAQSQPIHLRFANDNYSPVSADDAA